MKLTSLRCALGRHQVDREAIRHIHAGHVGRCRDCSTPLEESTLHNWTVLRLRDAGLGRQGVRSS